MNETLAAKYAQKIKFKAIGEIHSNDLDKLITEYFGFSMRDGYESVPENEWSNYSQYSFKLKKEPLDKWELEYLEAAKIGKWKNTNLRAILTHLCNEDILPECELVVKVSW